MPFPRRSSTVPTPFLYRSPSATLPPPCHSPRVLCFTLATASEIGMLLITNFLDHGVASRQHAVTLPPRPCHERDMNLPWPWEVAFRKVYSWHGRGTAGETHGNGTACVDQTRPHCVNQMGNTQSKALVEWHGRGTARKWQGNGREMAGEQQGNDMVCVNRPSLFPFVPTR
jgi:hypothetical protein